jgi:hypothetical protein
MHLEQIAVAKKRGKKIRRALGVATLSAWTTAVFGGLTVIFSITSPVGLLLGAGMCIVAFIEFRSVGELKRLDATAPRRMAINQLAFGVMLFLYGAINFYTSWRATNSEILSDPQIAQLSPEVADMAGKWERGITMAVYAIIMLAAFLGPGLTAWYYNTRTRYIKDYVSQTPQWILDLQRAGMSL